MKIELYIKNISRIDKPCNRSLHRRISSITKTKVGTIISNVIPKEDEIINYKGVNYEVYKVIRMSAENDMFEEYFILEVGVYNTNKLRTSGSDYWEEEIPLCIDIDEE